jgi:hypothetical protein
MSLFHQRSPEQDQTVLWYALQAEKYTSTAERDMDCSVLSTAISRDPPAFFTHGPSTPPDTVVEIEFRPSEKRVWLAVSAPNCCGRDTAQRERHGRPETDLQGSLELAVTCCVCGASQQVQNGVSLSNGT